MFDEKGVVYPLDTCYNESSTTKEAIMATKPKHNMRIRMDKDLHTAVKKTAESEHRNVTEQVHAMLKEALASRGVDLQA